MERLEIQPNKTTPQIIFDKEKEIFSVSGISRPESPTVFFAPVFDWLTEYFKKPNQKTVFNMKMEYFNTSTCKAFLLLFELLEVSATDGIDVHVNWHYLKDDDEMKEAGEELLELVTLPYSLVEIS